MSVDLTSQEFQDAVSTIVETKTYNWISDINTSFVLNSGYLVFMMQLGFALVSPQPCISLQPCLLAALRRACAMPSQHACRGGEVCATTGRWPPNNLRPHALLHAAHHRRHSSQKRKKCLLEESYGCLCGGCGVLFVWLGICLW